VYQNPRSIQFQDQTSDPNVPTPHHASPILDIKKTTTNNTQPSFPLPWMSSRSMLNASKNAKKESVTRLGLTRNRTGVTGMLLKKIRIRSANPYTIKP
jgi:hypothetical protein